VPALLPLIPLRGKVVLPHAVVPLVVGRAPSVAAILAAQQEDGLVFLAAQRRARQEDPGPDDLFDVGAVGAVIQVVRLADGTLRVLVEGRWRARIARWAPADDHVRVGVEPLAEVERGGPAVEALRSSVQDAFETWGRLRRVDAGLAAAIRSVDEPGRLADMVGAQLELKPAERQSLLESVDPAQRLERLSAALQAEVRLLQAERRIAGRIRRAAATPAGDEPAGPAPRDPRDAPRDPARDPVERDEFRAELGEIEERMAQTRLSAEARSKVERELKKLRMLQPLSAEAGVVRGYIDCVLGLPWDQRSEERLDVDEARRVLDLDHHALDRVKERVLEYLAVQALVRKVRGPILCLVGPPGVGKTSLAQSIARATGRRFVRQALGGVRDEAEIRGHRRTYVGAMPGKIVQGLRKAGVTNPVFLLDEVDKMSSDWRGDPAAALLEVLDPEQNHAFSDHYLDLDYDLSEVLFLCTANSQADIPAPLADRMEVLVIPGYSEEEKVEIARRHLVPKQREQCGIANCDVTFTPAALTTLVRQYTNEAGVRGLERELASICRKIAREVVARGDTVRVRVTGRTVTRYLGAARYRSGRREDHPQIGVASGLAVTARGGELLPTEVTVLPGKGKLILTGKLGDVMRESAQAAMSYVRSRAAVLGLLPDFHRALDVHVHCPEGATPKDGPSAGITMATALVSALLRVPVRDDVAMTGEITLRGRVLPVGGVREKLMAAARAGIGTVLIPRDNAKDTRDLPRAVGRALRVVEVETMDDVLRTALQREESRATEPAAAVAVAAAP
jgi:ATP-dependent Lon protease